MDKLHQSQVKAYREAAVQAIQEWALSFPLQPMEDGDTKIKFINRCTAAVPNELPNWKLDNAKVTAINEIRKRANATFEKYHPVEDKVTDIAITASKSGENGTADEAEDESEGGAETEEGELTSDDDEASDHEQTAAKNALLNRKKNRLAGIKKNMALKKNTKAKAGLRNNKGGRGSRRGGRGGGNRLQK